MDFFKVVSETTKEGIVIRPDFRVVRSKDLMIRGGDFYAVWDEATKMWSTDEYRVQELVDAELWEKFEDLGRMGSVKTMSSFGTKSWSTFQSFMKNLSDNHVTLDSSLCFLSQETSRSTYASKRLAYDLLDCETPLYDEIASTLYDPDELTKLEWAIGSVISGDSKNIQKFLVVYGEPGSGKSTYLNIVQELFKGYCAIFDARALTTSSSAFATAPFKTNPLVAIDPDGDLSRIDDNSRLNSIVSHDGIRVNEKFEKAFESRINALLVVSTNKPVRITDSKSGLIRRLIDVTPSGRLIPEDRYHFLTGNVLKELGGIANRCLNLYKELGKDYYSNYRPLSMLMKTDAFFNFVEEYYDLLNSSEYITHAKAYELYQRYCENSNLGFVLPSHKFREELKDYFMEYHKRMMVDGERLWSVYKGFKVDKFVARAEKQPKVEIVLEMNDTNSLLDDLLSSVPAQYAKISEKHNGEIPKMPWSKVETTLKDIRTDEVHYIKPDLNHVVIDFDLTGPNGEKSLELNLEEAGKWPPTYGELSKSGNGVHLHYNYTGDPTKLKRSYSPGVEVKVFAGDSSLRRKVSYCLNRPIATITTGLPEKENKVIDGAVIKSEASLIALIERNLRKEIHPGTRPSVSFIKKILDEAYESGLKYDVWPLFSSVMAFAMNSTHHADECLRMVNNMRFKSEEDATGIPDNLNEEKPIIYLDVEVFKNFFGIAWKYEGEDNKINKMFNPTPKEVEDLVNSTRFIGFNNRKYDNHMLYGRILGMSNQELKTLSDQLIKGDSTNRYGFSSAYSLSYADVYEYSVDKKSLKRWEIELGLPHVELDIDWDGELTPEQIEEVMDYCGNDTLATELVHKHCETDFNARKILASISGLPVNEVNRKHTAKIIFGDDKKPQSEFVYTDLSEMFPGYVYDFGKSTYLGEETGEGGLVRAIHGMYSNVGLLDIASMHPTSIIALNVFGKYTPMFEGLIKARLAIKHRDFETAGKLFDGKLKPYLNEEFADALSFALKLVINSVYGYTSARFDNPFRDPRNVDNIVAKRGALFMLDLRKALTEKGWPPIHIKTDSVKIADISPEIVDFIVDFGLKYGYTFEYEATYEKLLLVNDAVYVAKKDDGKWTATGAQFQQPYVFKTMFSKEPVTFEDLCIIKAVTTSLSIKLEDSEEMQYVGRVGSFCPMKSGVGAGELLRSSDKGYGAPSGSKGYLWMESTDVKTLGLEDQIDMTYFEAQVDQAYETISKYGDAGWFLD